MLARGKRGSSGEQPDYPYVRAWGHLMGSYGPHVEAQVRRARESGAPDTAVYEVWGGLDAPPTGRWQTVADLDDGATRDAVERYADHFRRGHLKTLN